MIDLRRFYGRDYRLTTDIVSRVLRSNPDAIVLIDPRTDAFQADSSLRLRIKSLMRIYGLAGYSEADVADDSKFSSASVGKALGTIVEKLAAVYRRRSIYGTNTLPYFLAPYFVAKRYNDDWYKLTLKAIKIAEEIVEDDVKFLAPIAIDKKVLESEAGVRGIVNDYATMDVHGYVILPFNLDEMRDAEVKLRNLALLATSLKKTGKLVIVHVAEFGNVLISLGVDAVTCGICMHKTPHMFTVLEKGLAEFARVETQLYVHSIFRKLHPAKFYRLVELIPNAYSCDCPICSEYTGSYYDLIEEAGYADFSVHYMYWKNKEVQLYSGKPDKLLEDFKQGATLLRKYNSMVWNEFLFTEESKYSYRINEDYIGRWMSVLRTFSHRDSTRT